jgi:hypothetical protein
MKEATETPQSSPKRLSVYWKMLIGGVGGAFAMMGLDFAVKAIFKIKTPMETYLPLIGIGIGASQAAEYHERGLEKERTQLEGKNIRLQHQIDELKAEKSFAQGVAEKLENASQAPTAIR